MSSNRQETIADIVAELRFDCPKFHADGTMYRDGDWVYTKGTVKRLADRIEAAANRESTCEESSQVGNAAAMREACENIAEYAKTAACHTEDAHLIGYLNQIERWAEDALAVPSRNCDKLNTADEAYAGFRKFCDVMECSECQFGQNTTTCRLSWLFAEAKGE